MSIQYQIPKDSHYLTTANIFTATFNIPTPGVYDFNAAGNIGQVVYLMQTDKVLLIERISIAGDITEDQYLEAINVFPQMTLRKSKTNEAVYIQSLPVLQYSDNTEIVAWSDSTKGGLQNRSKMNSPVVVGVDENLIMDFTGVLNQTAALVGKNTIRIAINLSIYVISSTLFYQRFKDKLSGQTGLQMSGAIR